MTTIEIVGLVISITCLLAVSIIFTIFYRSFTNARISDINSGINDIEIIDDYIHDNLSKVKVRRKIIGTIKSIVFYGLMVFIVPFFVFAVYSKIQGNIAILGDKGVLVVASGSMSVKHEENAYLKEFNLNNQFNKYDLIVIERIENVNDLNLYDVIAFTNDEGKTIIHRIVEINEASNGEIEFTTRGDANAYKAVDTYKPTIDDVQGKYINKKVSFIGIFVVFLQSPIGISTIVALVYCFIIMDRYRVKMLKEQDNRLEKLDNAINSLDDNIKDLSEYTKTVSYKGIVYIFNKNGFVDKIQNEENDSKSLSVSLESNEFKETINKTIEIE